MFNLYKYYYSSASNEGSISRQALQKLQGLSPIQSGIAFGCISLLSELTLTLRKGQPKTLSHILKCSF